MTSMSAGDGNMSSNMIQKRTLFIKVILLHSLGSTPTNQISRFSSPSYTLCIVSLHLVLFLPHMYSK
jgi:hypothetical protein